MIFTDGFLGLGFEVLEGGGKVIAAAGVIVVSRIFVVVSGVFGSGVVLGSVLRVVLMRVRGGNLFHR
jgi:hypothetical protein